MIPQYGRNRTVEFNQYSNKNLSTYSFYLYKLIFFEEANDEIFVLLNTDASLLMTVVETYTSSLYEKEYNRFE